MAKKFKPILITLDSAQDGLLSFGGGSTFFLHIFFSKTQALQLINHYRNSLNDPEDYIEQINDSTLPNFSQRKIINVPGEAAKLIGLALALLYREFDEIPPMDGGQRIRACVLPEPKAKGLKRIISGVIAIEDQAAQNHVYIFYSKLQFIEIILKHRQIIPEDGYLNFLSLLNFSILPMNSPDEMIYIDGASASAIGTALEEPD